MKEVWREILPYLESRFQEVLTTGPPTLETDVLMLLERSGYLEETYMRRSFAMCAMMVGAPSGIVCTATENTELVVTRRQTDCLRRLATRCATADSHEEACRIGLVVVGFGVIQVMAVSNTIIQSLVPDDKRARVMSYYTMAFFGAAPLRQSHGRSARAVHRRAVHRHGERLVHCERGMVFRAGAAARRINATPAV